MWESREKHSFLTRYCLSLISLGTYALRLRLVCVVDVRVRPRSSVGILEEALDLTVDLCTALFLHVQRPHGQIRHHISTVSKKAVVVTVPGTPPSRRGGR